jgi:hypothetical protein
VASAPEKILFVKCHDLHQVHAQRLNEAIRKEGGPILGALSIADIDLATEQIDVFDPQGHALRNSEAGAVHQLSHQQRRSSHAGKRRVDFLGAEHNRQAVLALNALKISYIPERLLQNRFVQKDDRIECLSLC